MKYRYLILSFFLLVLMLFSAVNVQQKGDFWAHSAAINELAENPFSPNHPFISSDDPSVLITPYTLGVAFFSKITNLDSNVALSIAGIFNLLLFLYGLKLFTSVLSSEKSNDIAFYALLFTMLLWGRDPWSASGYLYLNLMGEALPLPATFGFSLSLIALSIYMSITKGNSRLWYIPLNLITIVVIISNPQTFLFLAIGLVSISLSTRKFLLADYALLMCVFILTLIIALLWPYYPFSNLLPFKPNLYHKAVSSYAAYTSIFWRTFPALIGIPFIIQRFKSDKRDPVGIMLLLLSLVYAYGGLFGRYAYGRLISYIVFTLQVSAAVGVAQIESTIGDRFTRAIKKLNLGYLLLNVVIFIFIGALSWEGKRLFAKDIETTLIIKSVIFLSVMIISAVITSLLFKSPGWFYRLSTSSKKVAFSFFIMIMSFTVSFNEQAAPALERSLDSSPRMMGYYLPNDQYEFLSRFIKHNDVVLSDMKTSWVVPSFSGKIIAPLHPPCCVPDYQKRVWDTKYFFGDSTVHDSGIMKQFGGEIEFGPIPDTLSYSYQLEILRKYNVDYLLVNKGFISKWQKMVETFSPLGHIIFSDNNFVLISFDPVSEITGNPGNIIKN